MDALAARAGVDLRTALRKLSLLEELAMVVRRDDGYALAPPPPACGGETSGCLSGSPRPTRGRPEPRDSSSGPAGACRYACPVMGAIKPWHISVLCCLVMTAVLIVGLVVS